MASISASIELYDRMSAPLQSIMVAMNQTISSMYDMQSAMSTGMDTSSLDSARDAIQEANAQVQQLEQQYNQAGNEIQEDARHQQELNEQIARGNQNCSGFVDTLKTLALTYLTIESVKGALNASDELVSTTARLNMMNDGLQTTDELVQMVYASAQDARGSFSDMAAVVAKFGNNAKDAFGSSQEVVAFANLIQKQMTIAGASTQEASNAMLQLSQALGSGVLRGDELNSIFEQAPNLIQSIADYMDVPIGQIRQMASEGQLSADVVKQAIFASADDINAKFDAMPMTWQQLWTSFQNSALMAFQPVLTKLNELANSDQFQEFVNDALNAMSMLATFVLGFFEVLGSVATFISDNWSVISPLVWGVVAALAAYAIIGGTVAAINGIMATAAAVHAAAEAMQAGATFAATAAQYGLNAALMACPLTWIVLLVIALVAAIIAICQWIANATGVANSWFGVMTGGINVVIQFFKNLGLTVANIALGIWEAIGALCSNMGTAFNNVICNVQSWFYNLLSTALTVVAGICEALNKLPFVEFDYSGITSAADDYAAKASAAANNKEEYTSVSDAFNSGMSTFDTFSDGWASDAFKSGAEWGDGVADSVSSMMDGFTSGSNNLNSLTSGIDALNYDTSSALDGIGDSAASTADSASAVADSVDISSENLKYLRDIAETEAINRFTTAEITVNQTNNNNVSNGTDIDGMISSLTDGVNEAMAIAAEGVHE